MIGNPLPELSILIIIVNNQQFVPHKLVSLPYPRYQSMYGTARFKLDRKSCEVMRAHAMRVISLTFSSASTHKFTCTKILAGRFCVNTRVPIKAPYVCSKTIQHKSTYARDFPCKLREKYPTTCNQALLQMYAHSFILTAPVLNKEQ